MVLELTLHPDPAADPVQRAERELDLLSAVNHFDRTLGGDGYTKTGHVVKDGVIIITLTPIRRTGAANRIRLVAASIQPPDAVKLLTARVGHVE